MRAITSFRSMPFSDTSQIPIVMAAAMNTPAEIIHQLLEPSFFASLYFSVKAALNPSAVLY